MRLRLVRAGAPPYPRAGRGGGSAAGTDDRLVHYNADGDLQPGLATDWEFSDDGLQLTLTLREGVTMHDGATLDGEVVKANLECGQTVEGSAVVGDLATIESIEVPDPLTVVLNLSGPNSALPGILSSRAGVIVPPSAFGSDIDLEPMGAGPTASSSTDPTT